LLDRAIMGALFRLLAGVGMLLDYYPVTVVPVFIRGAYEAMPKGRFLRRSKEVTISFWEPFDPRGSYGTAGSREWVVEAVRERVVELGECR